MNTRPSGSLGGVLYDAFGAIQSGLATASSTVGIDPAAFMEQFHVPIAFSLMPLGVGSLILGQLGI